MGSKGSEFDSYTGQSFSLSLCGPISLTSASTQIDFGKQALHFTLQKPFLLSSVSTHLCLFQYIGCLFEDILQNTRALEVY